MWGKWEGNYECLKCKLLRHKCSNCVWAPFESLLLLVSVMKDVEFSNYRCHCFVFLHTRKGGKGNFFLHGIMVRDIFVQANSKDLEPLPVSCTFSLLLVIILAVLLLIRVTHAHPTHTHMSGEEFYGQWHARKHSYIVFVISAWFTNIQVKHTNEGEKALLCRPSSRSMQQVPWALYVPETRVGVSSGTPKMAPEPAAVGTGMPMKMCTFPLAQSKLKFHCNSL